MARPKYGFDVTEDEIARHKRREAWATVIMTVVVVGLYALLVLIS